MTGYTVHTGASKKFVAGWDKIFKGGKSGSEPTGKKTEEKPPEATKGRKKKS